MEWEDETFKEIGITREVADRVRQILEPEGYKVDFGLGLSVYPNRSGFEGPHAHLTTRDNVLAVSTSGSTWILPHAREFAAQLSRCVELLAQIREFAPTIVDAEYSESKRKAKADAAKAAMIEKIERWNALPQEVDVLLLPSGGKVVLTRSKTEYREGYRPEFYVGYEIRGADGRTERFYPGSYITRDGKVQKAKFLSAYSYNLDDDDKKAIAPKLLELVETRKKARQGDF
jgi:hypothetical protein